MMKMHYFAAPLLLFGLSSLACADGTVTHLSGPVSIINSTGKSATAQAGAKVVTGDTIVTGSGAYVRVEMSDGAEMVLRPDSSLRIDNYHFAQGKPAEDKSSFSMLKGGLRTISGMVGKRGNNDAYEMKTPTATIGIRGTQWDVRVCDGGSCGALANGTYLAVRFGAIMASNPHGSAPIAAGQFAHVPQGQAPVIIPRDPGIGFTPPPVIPKLDEKKKVQAEQQKAAASSPAASGGPAPAPASGGAPSTSSGNKPATGQESAPASSNNTGGASPAQTSGAATGSTQSGNTAGIETGGSTSASGPTCSLTQ